MRIYIVHINKKKTRATEAKKKRIRRFSRLVFTIKIGYKIEDKAQLFLNDEVTTIEDAIEGAKDIIAERISDNPQYRSKILKDVLIRD